MNQAEIYRNYKKLLPIIGESFKKMPLYFPLSEESPYYELFANLPQPEFQKSLDKIVSNNDTNWSISGYLENRTTILKDYPQMAAEKRFYHLGIDINITWGTKLYAPFDCEVEIREYEGGKGNYGGVIVLKCIDLNGGIFYLLFGHLAPEPFIHPGTALKKGDVFAKVGDMKQNGNWYYHTHLQILTQKAFDAGWVNKGYSKENEIVDIDEFCPNPFLFL